MMNERERFWRLMHFQPVDRIPLWADWLGPFNRWHGEGLPEVGERPRQRHPVLSALRGCSPRFGASRACRSRSVSIQAFPEVTLEETARHTASTAPARARWSGNSRNIPGSLKSTQWLEYPVKTRDDWVRLRDEQLNPDDPGRYPPPEEWAALKKAWCARDHVISIDGGSFYGYVRDWIGVENLSLILYDDPDLIHEMMDYLADFYVRVLRRAVEEVDIDFAMFWEDMCYKTGPLLSPAMFREFMLPGYKKVTAFLRRTRRRALVGRLRRQHRGACFPLWIEGGVRGHYPLEVASDMDAAKLRRQYGREIVHVGQRGQARPHGGSSGHRRRARRAWRRWSRRAGSSRWWTTECPMTCPMRTISTI